MRVFTPQAGACCALALLTVLACGGRAPLVDAQPLLATEAIDAHVALEENLAGRLGSESLRGHCGRLGRAGDGGGAPLRQFLDL